MKNEENGKKGLEPMDEIYIVSDNGKRDNKGSESFITIRELVAV
ncbi:hypothetical protein [Persephonella sp.]